MEPSKPVGANQMERALRWLECLTEPVLDLRRPTNRDAYRITLASCIVSVGFWATSFAMALAAADGSPALLSTVVESFIDAASSIFLLWRFSLGTPSTPQEERRDAFREHRARWLSVHAGWLHITSPSCCGSVVAEPDAGSLAQSLAEYLML